MEGLLARGAPWPGAVAVSGGGDSVALMLLLARWAKAKGAAAPTVLSVDHGLNPDSAKHARAVAAAAKGAGLKAHVLVWNAAKPKSDIEAAARDARYRLMGEWCRAHNVAGLYVAHSQDDQAETFLLRLARGSGVDGLAAMRAIGAYPMQGFETLAVVRPLLDASRSDLRGWLSARGQTWIEDPMNTDPRFARAKLRSAWGQLEALGLSAGRIADAAQHLSRAREALEDMTATLMKRAVRFDGEQALLDPLRLKMAPREVGLRALAAVLGRISGEEYRPRFERLERLFDAIRDGALGGGSTLHGCRIAPASRLDLAFGAGTLTIARETGRKRAD